MLSSVVNQRTLCFSDPHWEYLNISERDEILFKLAMQQLKFNKSQIKFFNNFYSNIDFSTLDTFQDLIENVPLLTKEILQKINDPFALMPDHCLLSKPNKIKVHRGTGGTTGKPFNMFYTDEEWESAIFASNKLIEHVFQHLNSPLIAFNNYNQGHISGLIFNDQVKALGSITVNRHFKADDEQALAQIIEHRCNMLICPPTSSKKGGTLESLLDIDTSNGSNYINGKNIHYLFLSSTGLTHALYDEIKSLGIQHIFCFYGSTEVLPIALSCEKNPFDYHIIDGTNYAVVINDQQKMVANGERGMLVAGRIATFDSNARTKPVECIPLMNYILGDEVTISYDECECGKRLRTISNIERKLHTIEKLNTGCEAWE
jgi:phenylacetate-coenzyme A ligase PaaK-like adenylate-forming protein